MSEDYESSSNPILGQKQAAKPALFKRRWLGLVLLVLALFVGLGWYWSRSPALFSVSSLNTQASVPVTGYATTATLIRLAETLLDKPGGYISNDVTPPGIVMDNMPNWEFGVLVQLRDMSRALRKDISRSQSQSAEDADLAIAEPQFNFDNSSWMFPASESEYRRGIEALQNYLSRLQDTSVGGTQFYARADNLNNWLGDVGTRLGSLSQRLSASVGRDIVNTDLAGDSAARQSTESVSQFYVKTPWSEIDDVFYEARGYSWALLHQLKAIQIDFSDVLEKKNARASLEQIIRELESSQEAVWSPMILNGGGFGFLANHSLVMANYISRANAAIIDLRTLLEQG